MPLVHSENIGANCTLLLWKLTEPEDVLRQALGSGFNSDELGLISHPQKKREWLASRMLIKTLVEQFGIAYMGLHKDEHGKAYLIDNDSHISITHTFDYVAVAIHPRSAVGIDMEKEDEKLQRISRKFLSPNEHSHAADRIPALCAYWCAKEALYKMHGKKKVSLKDGIYIRPFEDGESQLSGILTDPPVLVHSNIHLRWFDSHCLAVAL